MTSDIALMILTLFTVSTYLLLQERMVSIILGVALFSNAVNLIILTAGGTYGEAEAPILAGETAVSVADPLPHAMILTAIVIGFGLLSFFIGLLYKLFSNSKKNEFSKIFGGENG